MSTKDEDARALRAWIARGTVTLRGVTFYLGILTREQAERRVREHKFDDTDYDGAEMSDWTIDAKTLEPDE